MAKTKTIAQTLFETAPVDLVKIKKLKGEIIGSIPSGTMYWFPDHSIALLMFGGTLALVNSKPKGKTK